MQHLLVHHVRERVSLVVALAVALRRGRSLCELASLFDSGSLLLGLLRLRLRLRLHASLWLPLFCGRVFCFLLRHRRDHCPFLLSDGPCDGRDVACRVTPRAKLLLWGRGRRGCVREAVAAVVCALVVGPVGNLGARPNLCSGEMVQGSDA
jgi:hypothetical protein